MRSPNLEISDVVMTIRDWCILLSGAIIIGLYVGLLIRNRVPSDPPNLWIHDRVIGRVVDSYMDDTGLHIVMKVDNPRDMEIIRGDIGAFSLGPMVGGRTGEYGDKPFKWTDIPEFRGFIPNVDFIKKEDEL